MSSTAKRQSKIESMRAQLHIDRKNAELWEKLSLHLAMNQENYRESIEALKCAEAIYRDRGNIIKAEELVKAIASFSAKI